MDLIDSLAGEPLSALANNSHILIEGAPETLPGAFAETDIDEDDDFIIFGVPYDFGFEIIHDDLHDSLYDGMVVRGADGKRSTLKCQDMVVEFADGMDWSAAEEIPLDLEKVCARIRSFLIGLLSSERYGLDAEYLEEALEVGDVGADGNRIEISLGVRADTALTVGEVYDKFVWPFFAALANSTDPGTFNHPYWASTVCREIEKEEMESATH